MHILEEGHNFFTNVGDLAAGNGKLFVADNDQMRVFSFDAAIGSRLVASDPVTARVPLGPSFIVKRLCLALAPDGSRLFVSHIRGVTILEPSTLRQLGRLSHPGGTDAFGRPIAFAQAMAVLGEHLIVCAHGPLAPRAVFEVYTLDGEYVKTLSTGHSRRRSDSTTTWVVQRLVAAHGRLYAVEKEAVADDGQPVGDEAAALATARILVFAVNVNQGCLYRLQSAVHPDCADNNADEGEKEDDASEASISLRGGLCVRGDQLIVANGELIGDDGQWRTHPRRHPRHLSKRKAKQPLGCSCLLVDCGPS